MIALLTLALAADTQRITIAMQDVPGGTQVSASRDGSAPVPLVDKGIGGLTATFEGPPARMMQVQILINVPGQTQRVYDGMEALADVEDDTLSFTYDKMVGVRRVAASPTSAIPLLRDDDAALRVGFTWAGLTMVWVIGMGVVWARRRG